MQKIDNIEIKNFKSIRHQKIEGCKRINVFVGPPNVGKSNILEGLSLFGLLDYSLSQPISIQKLTRVSKNHQLFFNGLIDKKVSISLNNNLSFDIVADSNLDINFSAIEEFPVIAPINTSTWKDYPRRTSLNKFQFSSINDNIRTDSIYKSNYLNPIKSIRKYIFNKSNVNVKFDTLVKHLIFPFGENISDIIFSNSEVKNHFIKLFEIFDLRISRSETQGNFNILNYPILHF
jgi:AAA15 family ATPase/GTPase